MLLIDNTAVIFDVETTDANLSLNPAIVEIGGVKVDIELNVIDDFSQIVNPKNDEFTEFCENLTGINEAALKAAPTWSEVWEEWAKFTGYNRARLISWTFYDIYCLRYEYDRLKLGYPHNKMPICAASMTYAMAIQNKLRASSLGLRKICHELAIPCKGQHRALDDAYLTLKVLQKLFKEEEREEKYEVYGV